MNRFRIFSRFVKQRTLKTKDFHMRMPFLPMAFHPPATPTSRARGLLMSLVAGAACLGAGGLSAQSSEDAQLAELKARLAAMEAQMKSMQAQVALSASIAQSRKLTGPDGKEISMEGGPVIIPALSTFTRNFATAGYFRAGTGFTGNGVGQTGSISEFPNMVYPALGFVWEMKTTPISNSLRS